MRFPNAYVGVKKIYASELLSIISGVAFLLAAVGTFFTVFFAGAGGEGGLLAAFLSGGLSFILVLAGAVIGVIALIFKIIGVNSAKADAPAFKTAMLFIYIALACTAVSSALKDNAAISSIASVVGAIAELGTTMFIIQGIRNLADRLNNGAVSAKGAKIFKALLIMYAITVLSSVISIFSADAAAVLDVVASLVSIVIYFVFLSYLSNAKKMLSK